MHNWILLYYTFCLSLADYRFLDWKIISLRILNAFPLSFPSWTQITSYVRHLILPKVHETLFIFFSLIFPMYFCDWVISIELSSILPTFCFVISILLHSAWLLLDCIFPKKWVKFSLLLSGYLSLNSNIILFSYKISIVNFYIIYFSAELSCFFTHCEQISIHLIEHYNNRNTS